MKLEPRFVIIFTYNACSNIACLQFRNVDYKSDPSKLHELKLIAESYALLLSSTNELGYLLALDTGDKLTPEEKIINTAARVGFVLPPKQAL